MQDQSQLFYASILTVAETGAAIIGKAPNNFAQPGQSSRFALAAEIEDFLAETGMKPTPFGLAAARDDKLLWRIKNAPKGISLDKADRIRNFMAEMRQSSRKPDDDYACDREQEASAC